MSHLTKDELRGEAPAWICFIDEFKTIADGFPKLTFENFKEQKLSPSPSDVRARFSAHAMSSVEKLLAQSKLLNDLLVRYGLGNIAEIQANKLKRIVSQFGLSQSL